MTDAFALEPLDEGSRLIVIDIEALLDGLLLFSPAPLFFDTVKEKKYIEIRNERHKQIKEYQYLLRNEQASSSRLQPER